MPPLLILGGIVAAALFGLKLLNPGRQLTPEELAAQQAQAGANIPLSYKEEQIRKFTAIATIAGSAAVVTTAALSSLTLAAAGPVGAVVAAAVVAIGIFRGTAHLVANEWVDNVQVPFERALRAIVDEKDASLKDGSATRASVSQAQLAVSRLWQHYREVAENFALQGNDYRTVIDQSYETLDYRMVAGQRVGTGLITRILSDMQVQINAL